MPRYQRALRGQLCCMFKPGEIMADREAESLEVAYCGNKSAKSFEDSSGVAGRECEVGED